MASERPRILITNDDGIHSEGIAALDEAMQSIGDVYVVAPQTEMSGASHSLTLARPSLPLAIEAASNSYAGQPPLNSSVALLPDGLPACCRA